MILENGKAISDLFLVLIIYRKRMYCKKISEKASRIANFGHFSLLGQIFYENSHILNRQLRKIRAARPCWALSFGLKSIKNRLKTSLVFLKRKSSQWFLELIKLMILPDLHFKKTKVDIIFMFMSLAVLSLAPLPNILPHKFKWQIYYTIFLIVGCNIICSLFSQ